MGTKKLSYQWFKERAERRREAREEEYKTRKSLKRNALAGAANLHGAPGFAQVTPFTDTAGRWGDIVATGCLIIDKKGVKIASIEKSITAEEIKKTPIPYKGGRIIFSVDITQKAPDLATRIKNKLISWARRYITPVRVKEVEEAWQRAFPEEPGKHGKPFEFTLGHPSIGLWQDPKTGRVFDERSLAIEVFGVTSEELERLADELRREFNQDMVLLQDYNTGAVFKIE